MEGIESQVAVVEECVATFRGLVSAVSNADPTAFALRDKVFQLESMAQDMGRSSELKIAEGAFFGGVREDILNLIGEIDTIARATKDAARLLVFGTEGEACPDILKNDHMPKFLDYLASSLASLGQAVKSLQTDRKSVVIQAQNVDKLEEEADAEKAALLEALLKPPRTLDPVTTIQLRDFIFAADNIADYSVNASDVLIVLVAKGYG
jgi:predicted phosphate transport protein (TIGR00153 family)